MRAELTDVRTGKTLAVFDAGSPPLYFSQSTRKVIEAELGTTPDVVPDSGVWFDLLASRISEISQVSILITGRTNA